MGHWQFLHQILINQKMAKFNFMPDNSGNQTATFMGKLINIGENVLNLNNNKQTEYLVGTVEFENAKNETVQRSAIIYMANYKHGMTTGNTYLCNLTLIADKNNEPVITVSHLQNASRATADDFGFQPNDALVSDPALKATI